MRLLFDQNLSRHLVGRLAERFPGTSHVALLSLDTATDSEIWAYARAYEFIIVSKDSDFAARARLEPGSAKVVHLAVGNASTSMIESLLLARSGEIDAFARSGDALLVIAAVA